jgi:hypothetical protein
VYCNFLPLHERSPAHPFSNFVVNVCACTKGHRDHGDKKYCATFFIGSFEGAELCLHETGVVFDARPGEMIVFQSAKETHFNLHLKGTRCSIVFHSDRTGDIWADNYNRWGSHVL